MEQQNPTKFHKSMGNVKDDNVSEGEIRFLQYIIRDCENCIVNYRMKEIKTGEKIKKLWDDIKEFKELAQESRIFVDQHPLFAAMAIASGIRPEQGRKLFYKRIEDKINKKVTKKKKENAENKKAKSKKAITT